MRSCWGHHPPPLLLLLLLLLLQRPVVLRELLPLPLPLPLSLFESIAVFVASPFQLLQCCCCSCCPPLCCCPGQLLGSRHAHVDQAGVRYLQQGQYRQPASEMETSWSGNQQVDQLTAGTHAAINVSAAALAGAWVCVAPATSCIRRCPPQHRYTDWSAQNPCRSTIPDPDQGSTRLIRTAR